MRKLFEPHLKSLTTFLFKHLYVVIGSVLSTVLTWYYFEFKINDPLNKEGVVGFLILFHAIYFFARFIYRFFASILILLVLFNGELILKVQASESNFQVFTLKSNKKYDINLTENYLYIFEFNLNELIRTDSDNSDPEKIDCLEYKNTFKPDFFVKFCGYSSAYLAGKESILQGADGKQTSTFNLYDLETGGGGEYSTSYSIPATRLKQYIDSSNLKIELLSRAILPNDHKYFKKFFTGYGLYGFILFRENSLSGKERRIHVANAQIRLLPDWNNQTFGIKRENIGVIIYPTLFDSSILEYVLVYNDIWVNDATKCDENCIASALVEKYNYDYARYALKKIQHATEIQIPEISLVFVPKKAANSEDTFFLSNFDWKGVVIFNLDNVNNLEKFFIELNNALTYNLYATKPDLLSSIRKFAESTGRLALIMFE